VIEKINKENKFNVLTEEEFNAQLKKQVNKLKELFDDKKENEHDDEER